eukprot:TRINITY_DN19985_c0_g1_i1.p1 TRINITY_DN19985_c0_g1~~TRINITY_DN19985_c0_g1_i1.p1  ORF type:complete len:197 (+),score=18.97 TRINITY_DN19985_c0_g1_i1:50-640(+)
MIARLLLLVCFVVGASCYCDLAPPDKFQWSNCLPGAPSKVNSLEVNPFPVDLGKNVTLSFDAVLSETIQPDNGKYFSTNVTVYKRSVGLWVYIPCIDGLGSCSKTDFCADLHPDGTTCKILKHFGLPCACPIAARDYKIPASAPAQIETTNPDISWLTNGYYCIAATVHDPTGNAIGCLEVYAKLTATLEGGLIIS